MLAAAVYKTEAELRGDTRAIRMPNQNPNHPIQEIFHREDLRLIIAISPYDYWRIVHRCYVDGEFDKEFAIMLRDPWDGMD